MKRAAAIFCLGLVALAACSPPPVPDVTYFRLPAPAPLPHAAKPLSLLPLEIDVFSAEGIYAEQALIYAIDSQGSALRTYHYQVWGDPPTHALQQRLVNMLRESGIATLVTDRLPASTPALRVQGTIRRYERIKHDPSYSVAVTILMRVEQERGEPLIEQEYSAEADATDSKMDSTVAAFGVAVDKVFAKFYADLAALEGEAHAG